MTDRDYYRLRIRKTDAPVLMRFLRDEVTISGMTTEEREACEYLSDKLEIAIYYEQAKQAVAYLRSKSKS